MGSDSGVPRILIYDEHGVYRLGLLLTLRLAWTDWDILEAGSIEEVSSLLRADPPIDVALLEIDLDLADSSGILRDLLRASPTTRFIVLIPANSREQVLEVISFGLHGAVSKAQPDEEIILAVSDVLSGRVYVPPWMATMQVEDEAPQAHHGDHEPAGSEARLSLLTPRQKEVFLLVSDGLSNKEIAHNLSISEATAKIHVAAVFRTMRVRNRTEAALLAKKYIER